MTRVTQLIHDAGKYLLISVYPLPTHPTHNFTHNNGGNLETLPGWPKKLQHNRPARTIQRSISLAAADAARVVLDLFNRGIGYEKKSYIPPTTTTWCRRCSEFAAIKISEIFSPETTDWISGHQGECFVNDCPQELHPNIWTFVSIWNISTHILVDVLVCWVCKFTPDCFHASLVRLTRPWMWLWKDERALSLHSRLGSRLQICIDK